jgi:hypothetical protein
MRCDRQDDDEVVVVVVARHHTQHTQHHSHLVIVPYRAPQTSNRTSMDIIYGTILLDPSNDDTQSPISINN